MCFFTQCVIKKEIGMKVITRGVLFVLSVAIALCSFPQTSTQAQGGTTSTTGSARRSGATSKHTADALIRMEKEDWEVAKKKDWKAYDRLLAEDFVWVDASGVIAGRTPVVRYLSDLDLKDYSLEDVQVTMLSKDVALLTYKVTQQGAFRGQALPSAPSYVSSEWVRRGGRWVNVFTQMTEAK
jgi:hypothetical protein